MPIAPPRLLILLLLAQGTTALAGPGDTVVVPGYGAVPLEDARATCTNGAGIGALAGPGDGPREAALVEWGRQKVAVHGADPEGWPRTEADLGYTDIEIPWVPRGVVTSCWAVGRYDVEQGLKLRATCDSDRSACRDAFAENEREVVQGALRAKVKHRKDGMFAALALLPNLSTWQSPAVALERACTWPQQASAAGRFIDTDDLQAARSACVQLMELITGDGAAEAAALPCAGPWAEWPSDVLRTPETDLGVQASIDVASSEEVQLSVWRDKLTRMNPAAVCDASTARADLQPLALYFGATWSEGLRSAFRDAQSTKACLDDQLPLDERLALCPTLVESSERGCSSSDHVACDLLAQLYLEGAGVEEDEERAFDVWQASCNAAHGPACEALEKRSDRIDGWFDEAIAAAQRLAAAATSDDPAAPSPPPPEADPFQRASDLLAQFGSALGPEWVGGSAGELFDVAIAAEQAKTASDLLTLYGPTLGEAWKTEANKALGELKKELEKRKTP